MCYCLLIFLIFFVYELLALSEEHLSYESDITNSLEGGRINISYDLKPKLIIFNTDKTIWPFTIPDIEPPFNKLENGTVLDTYGKHLQPFKNVPQLLETLHEEGYKLGIAADSCYCEITWEVLELLDLHKHIRYRACYEGSKERLVMVIHSQSGINYEDILYLTHDWKGIREVGLLRTVVILTDEEEGPLYEDIRRGLHVFKTRATTFKLDSNRTELRNQMFLNF